MFPTVASDGELPEVFRERIRALGKRRRSKPLRQFIVDIGNGPRWASFRSGSGWTTAICKAPSSSDGEIRPTRPPASRQPAPPGAGVPHRHSLIRRLRTRAPDCRSTGQTPGAMVKALVKPAGAMVISPNRPEKPWSNAEFRPFSPNSHDFPVPGRIRCFPAETGLFRPGFGKSSRFQRIPDSVRGSSRQLPRCSRTLRNGTLRAL